MKRVIASAALVCAAAAAHGDTVLLRSGEVLVGEAQDHGDRLRVRTEGGEVVVRWRDVEVVKRGRDARQVYAERRADVAPDDANGLYALSLWAGRAGLPEERRACLEAVLRADPEHEAARAGLAQQRKDGAWLGGSALLEAKGFVARDGQWVLAEEAARLDRAAAAAAGLRAEERRAESILERAAKAGPAGRKLAVEAVAGLPDAEVLRPALRALRRGDAAEREVAAAALGEVEDVDALRPLIHSAVMDREPAVRSAAVASLARIGAPEVAEPLARAMWSAAPAVRMNAAEALGGLGGARSVEWVIRRIRSGGGPGGRNHIFVGSDISYISDFDVEIAQAAQIGDPIVGRIREGVSLDARVLSVQEDVTVAERRVYYRALARATGKDFGEDLAAWERWFEREGREALAQAR